MRRIKKITIPTGDTSNRDAGKSFMITEMPADQGERWALRALLLLAACGVDMPEGAAAAGLAGFMAMGVKSLDKLKFEDVQPLMDEMMGCVRYVPPNATLEPQPLLAAHDSQIEEITTRMVLKKEVLELHVGFLKAANASTTG